jgi:hypothetical protein
MSMFSGSHIATQNVEVNMESNFEMDRLKEECSDANGVVIFEEFCIRDSYRNV